MSPQMSSSSPLLKDLKKATDGAENRAADVKRTKTTHRITPTPRPCTDIFQVLKPSEKGTLG